MDSTEAVTHIGLCAGYGGIELGLHRAIRGMRTVALCEIEAFAIANLVAKMEAGLMDPAPVWPDLKTFPWSEFRDRVDILTGGYPCQPFSAAGKRAGKDDPRHLWPWIADGIQLLRPKLCFFENVEGHISLGLSDVIEDLAGMGYRTTWGIFSASEVGAPHQRKRVFILAHNQRERIEELGGWIATRTQQHTAWNYGSNAWPSRPGEQQYGWEPPRVVADTKESGQREWQEDLRCAQSDRTGEAMGDTGYQRQEERQLPTGGPEQSDQNMADASIIGSDGRPDGTCRWIREPREASGDAARCGGEGNGMRQTQPPLGGDTDGAPGGMDYAELCVAGDNRTDELRLLGNGVVPATAERAFRVLIKELL
jgi:DNA (cytosine-5)-methyltransferase 1